MDVREFLRWWGEQLADWLPSRLRSWLADQGTALLLQADGDGWQLTLRRGRRSTPLGRYPGIDTAELKAALSDHPTAQRVVLELPANHYLARSVDLPMAAAADLEQAIGYQIQTLTPFGRDQLWLFCGESQRLPDGKRLRAWLVAVPRHAAQVLQSLGLADASQPPRGPRQAPAEGSTVALSFRPASGGATAIPLGWVLLGLNALALLLAAGLHLDNREAELALLKDQGRALQVEAVAASDLEREADRLQQRLDTLQQQHDAHTNRVALIEEVSRRLDDQTWVQRLELRQQQLRLQGLSSNASALIGELGASPLLDDVRFEASLTRDASGGERFNLAGDVVPPARQTDQETQP